MNTRALLADHIANHDLCPGTSTVDEWLASNWVRFRFGRWLIPVIPLWGFKKVLVAHDVYHALVGYDTTRR